MRRLLRLWVVLLTWLESKFGSAGRLLGILGMVVVLYGVLVSIDPEARDLATLQTLTQYLGFYGVLTLAVGLLIVAGGIDLSIGSLVALGAVGYTLLLQNGLGPVSAAVVVVFGAALIGLCHGLLVTKLNLQPFLVTLCGLFIYRGVTRWAAANYTSRQSIELPDVAGVEWLREFLVSGSVLGLSHQFLLLLFLGGLMTVFLHLSVHGRYLYAIGYNEQAARYAGISTNRYKVLAYVLCSTLVGLGGVLHLLHVRTTTAASAGSLLELYAITGAVLGGCSLRGGEGTVAGMLLGAAVLPLLREICTRSPYIGTELEYTVIGAALLFGTIANELVARRSAARAG
jgi:ribose transport system permease protein